MPQARSGALLGLFSFTTQSTKRVITSTTHTCTVRSGEWPLCCTDRATCLRVDRPAGLSFFETGFSFLVDMSPEVGLLAAQMKPVLTMAYI